VVKLTITYNHTSQHICGEEQHNGRLYNSRFRGSK
jgi:hypothetical protein